MNKLNSFLPHYWVLFNFGELVSKLLFIHFKIARKEKNFKEK